jgi:hypothetical protein
MRPERKVSPVVTNLGKYSGLLLTKNDLSWWYPLARTYRAEIVEAHDALRATHKHLYAFSTPSSPRRRLCHATLDELVASNCSALAALGWHLRHSSDASVTALTFQTHIVRS